MEFKDIHVKFASAASSIAFAAVVVVTALGFDTGLVGTVILGAFLLVQVGNLRENPISDLNGETVTILRYLGIVAGVIALGVILFTFVSVGTLAVVVYRGIISIFVLVLVVYSLTIGLDLFYDQRKKDADT